MSDKETNIEKNSTVEVKQYKRANTRAHTFYLLFSFVISYALAFIMFFIKFMYTQQGITEIPILIDVFSIICYIVWGSDIADLVYICIKAALGRLNYQIYVDNYDDLEATIHLNSVDEETFTLRIIKDKVHQISVNDVMKDFFYRTKFFRSAVESREHSLQSIELDPIDMFSLIAREEAEKQVLKFKIIEEKQRISDIRNLPDLIFRSGSPGFIEQFKSEYKKKIEKKLQESSSSIDKDIDIFKMQYQTIIQTRNELLLQLDKQLRPETYPEPELDLEQAIQNIITKETITKEENKNEKKENKKQSKKLTKKQSKKASKKTSKKKEEEEKKEDETETPKEEDENSDKDNLKELRLNYESLFNLRQKLEVELRRKFNISEENEYQTYYVEFEKPKWLIMDWMNYSQTIHDEKGSTGMFLTVPKSWKEAFNFPRRTIYDYDWGDDIKVNASLPTFQFIEDIFPRLPWLIVTECNLSQRENWKICMHLTQIKDEHQKIIEWYSYHSLHNNNDIRKEALNLRTEVERVKNQMETLKLKNMLEWIKAGQFPNLLIDKLYGKMREPAGMSATKYWVFFSVFVIVSFALGVMLSKFGVL